MASVQGHEWRFVGGPLAALEMSQRLAVVLGPVALSVLQHALAAGAGAAVARLVTLAAEETQRAKVAAAATVKDPTPDVLETVLATVREVTGAEVAGQVNAALASPEFRAWAATMLESMTRDGHPVDPKDPDVTGGEFMAALMAVGREQAVFR